MPGVIQAEDFNHGGQFKAYYAETAGNHGNSRYRKEELVDVDIFEGGKPLIRYVRSSSTNNNIHEWLNYAFRITEAGWYEIVYRSRSADHAEQVDTLIDDRFIGSSGRIDPGSTFSDVMGVSAVFLTKATHNLKLDLHQTGICIDSIRFRRIETPYPIPQPFSACTPSEIVVADFDVTKPPFNADNSGASDAAKAIQNALDQLGRLGGGTVFLPAGHYMLKTGGLDLPEGVALVGSWQKPPTDNAETGTVIDVYYGALPSEDHPAIMLAGINSCVRNLSIYYPKQYPDTKRKSTFDAYPFSIDTGRYSWGHTIRNITLYNSYKGIRVSAGSAHTIADIYGTVLNRGIVTGNGYEFSYMSKVDFRNSFWTGLTDPGDKRIRPLDDAGIRALYDYTNEQLTGIQLGKNDGYLVYDITVQDARVPILVKRLPEDELPEHPLLKSFWGVISKVNGEIFEVDSYVFPNVHYSNTDLIPQTASMEYVFRPMPGVKRSGKVALYNVKSGPFGAVGDGITDDTESIQQALDLAGKVGGGIVYLPLGQYKVMGHLSVPSGVELRGPHGAVRRSPKVETCVLLAFEGRNSRRALVDTAFITLQANSGIRGFSVVYPEQSYGRTLSSYPFTIRGKGRNVWIVDIDLENSYLGIDLTKHQCNHHFVSDICATVFKEGIDAGGGSRDGQIQRTLISWGPWGGSSRQNAPHFFGREDHINQIKQNTIAYVFGRSRNESTFAMTSFQQFLHILIRGDCRDAYFWQPAGDNSQNRNIRVDAGGTITLIGAFASIHKKPWLETGPAFNGIVRVFDYLLFRHKNNVPVNRGGRIELFSENSLTTGKSATADRSCRDNPPSLAVDANERSYWCSDCSAGDCSLSVDLGQPSEIFRWEVQSAGKVKDAGLKRSNASLQYSLDNHSFQTADTFYGSINYIDRGFSPMRARYLKLKITDPGVDSHARITEFNVFGKPGWHFRTSSEGWTGDLDVTEFSADNSRLSLRSGGIAPSILSQDGLGIAASDFRRVHIRMRNLSSSTDAQLFFITTTDSSWNARKSAALTITAHDKSFKEYIFDFSRNSSWTGKIKRLRFAPIASEGKVEIDSIEFGK